MHRNRDRARVRAGRKERHGSHSCSGSRSDADGTGAARPSPSCRRCHGGSGSGAAPVISAVPRGGGGPRGSLRVRRLSSWSRSRRWIGRPARSWSPPICRPARNLASMITSPEATEVYVPRCGGRAARSMDPSMRPFDRATEAPPRVRTTAGSRSPLCRFGTRRLRVRGTVRRAASSVPRTVSRKYAGLPATGSGPA